MVLQAQIQAFPADMNTRIATCSCGRLTATEAGEPARVSVCHCLACQRRTGSVFGAQVRFAGRQVSINGEVGAFAEPTFTEPTFSVYEERIHSWVGLPVAIERMA